MSVNDIVTSGAKPLFFLDYFATSHLEVDLAEKVYVSVIIVGMYEPCQLFCCSKLVLILFICSSGHKRYC